jgi:hypothetical protein
MEPGPLAAGAKKKKERNSIIEKDYHGLIERIKCLHIFSTVVGVH